jgi:hypothetical protein
MSHILITEGNHNVQVIIYFVDDFAALSFKVLNHITQIVAEDVLINGQIYLYLSEIYFFYHYNTQVILELIIVQ